MATEATHRKIRIAQIRSGYSTGGPERVLRDLAAHLDRSRFDLSFFFLGKGGSYVDEVRQMGFPVQVISARNGYDLKMRGELFWHLRRFRPDIVHDHGVPPFTRLLAKGATRARSISFEHGEIEINRRRGKPWINLLNGFEYRAVSDLILVNSEANRRLVIKTHRLSPTKVRVIRLGVDLVRFPAGQPDGIGAPEAHHPPKSLVLGYVGRILNYDKGTDFLPRLAVELRRQCCERFKIRVIGDGPDRAGVQGLAEQLGVASHFEFLGHRNDVEGLLSSVDILVVPSRLEAFGLAAIEALAMGIPVVAFAVGGLVEVLEGCSAARLVPPGNVTALASAIVDLHRHWSKQRSVDARQFATERYDIRRTILEIEESYLALAGQPS